MKELFVALEIILVLLGIISLCMNEPIGIVAPFIFLGFYYEDKFINFESAVWQKTKNKIKKVAELLEQFKRQGKDHNHIIKEKGDKVK